MWRITDGRFENSTLAGTIQLMHSTHDKSFSRHHYKPALQREERFTRHAKQRAQQRAISLAAVPLIKAYGRQEHDGRGGMHYLMTHDAVERLARVVGHSAALERLKGVYLVADALTGAVITISHSW
jgi:hypothetical protein